MRDGAAALPYSGKIEGETDRGAYPPKRINVKKERSRSQSEGQKTERNDAVAFFCWTKSHAAFVCSVEEVECEKA